MNAELYEPTIWRKGFFLFVKVSEWEPIEAEALAELAKDMPVMSAFLDDDNIQQMTITSSSIGCSWTYQKRYRRQPVK